jgi:mono/diheme cytochrome c family protein
MTCMATGRRALFGQARRASALGLAVGTIAVGVLLILAGNAASAAPQSGPAADPAGVFTDQQAVRGHEVYLNECARCHSDNLIGGEDAPALSGDAFLSAWYGKTIQELLTRTRTMPADSPGRLTPQQYLDLVAYILQGNHFRAGDRELQPTSSEALRQIITRPSDATP